MKRLLCLALFMQTLFGDAGAMWLLIQPGAGPAGIGNAMVTKTDNSLMSYYNPAGLAFLTNSHVSFSRFEWIPGFNLDIYHNFLSFSHQLNETTVLGGNVIYFYDNFQYCFEGGGCQDMSNEFWSITLNYSLMLSSSSSVGFGLKAFKQNWIDFGSGAGQPSKTEWINYAFDIGYLKKFNALDFGLSIVNMRDGISFISPSQADPSPINLRTGISSVVYDDVGSLRLSFDIQKLLVASYADMDWDGDGIIGGCDENGHCTSYGDYNSDGQKETAHNEENWFVGMFTSWIDDWLLGGDIDYSQDGIIGGYDENGLPTDSLEFGDSGYGQYGLMYWGNEEVTLEVGSGDNRSIQDEIDEMTFNIGIEYNYINFVFRYGYSYREDYKIDYPAFGLGFNYKGFQIDYAQLGGEEGYPFREGTQYFSLSYEF